MDRLIEELAAQLQHETNTNPHVCHQVAARLIAEVQRICQVNSQLQTASALAAWRRTLVEHRCQQCLRYHQLGSQQGRGELHSRLSAIIYRYLKLPGQVSSYQQRMVLIKDCLHQFYLEAFNLFRQEHQLADSFQPRSRLELAEYMAFCERYAKRRICLPNQRSQQLIILRARALIQGLPPEWSPDLAATTEPTETSTARSDPVVQHIRAALDQADAPATEPSRRDVLVKPLIQYLQQQGRQDCVDYFILRLEDLPTAEIEAILKLTPRQRNSLQQRFKHHLIQFALSHQWELVHHWLEADLGPKLGLTAGEWQRLEQRLDPEQRQLLTLKQRGQSWSAIAKTLNWTPTQTRKQWFQLLAIVWEIRNHSVS